LISNILDKALAAYNFYHPHKKNHTKGVTSPAIMVLMYRKRHSAALILLTAHLVIQFAPATICLHRISTKALPKTADSTPSLTPE
jgi:hypothetical protein